MNRGEVWLAEVGRKRRPALGLTRTEVIDVRALVTVAEITNTSVGLDQESVVNRDSLHTIAQFTLTVRVGDVDDGTMHRVCTAMSDALGC